MALNIERLPGGIDRTVSWKSSPTELGGFTHICTMSKVFDD